MTNHKQKKLIFNPTAFSPLGGPMRPHKKKGGLCAHTRKKNLHQEPLFLVAWLLVRPIIIKVEIQNLSVILFTNPQPSTSSKPDRDCKMPYVPPITEKATSRTC